MENSRLGGKETDYKKLNISPEPHPSEDGMHLSGREGTFEWWYFDSEFEDGTKTTIVFYTKNRFDADGPAWAYGNDGDRISRRGADAFYCTGRKKYFNTC